MSDELLKQVQSFMGTNINDYNAIPTTNYRETVIAIQDEVKRLNLRHLSDDQRLTLLMDYLKTVVKSNDRT